MARLIIPTRNRSTSLSGVLNYLRTFYPETELIIADGSSEEFKARNRSSVETLKGALEIDYRPYPEELPLFDRLLDVLRSETDEMFIMGADDDFPIMGTLDEGERFLRNHPEFSTAMGALVSLFLESDDLVTARLNPARPIQADDVDKRVKTYSAWSFSTTYAVTRRDLLLERYERARTQFLAGFYDFIVGVHDATWGKIAAIPKLGFLCTRNYNHSYLRRDDGLAFLRHAATILEIREVFNSDLQARAHLSKGEAEALSEVLLRRRLSESLGHFPHRKPGFADSPMFQNERVQKQWKLFHELFEPDTSARRDHFERLRYVFEALLASAKSQDNAGEAKTYETLDAQIAKKADSTVPSGESRPGAAPRGKPRPGAEYRSIEVYFSVDPQSMLRVDPDSGT